MFGIPILQLFPWFQISTFDVVHSLDAEVAAVIFEGATVAGREVRYMLEVSFMLRLAYNLILWFPHGSMTNTQLQKPLIQ
jgi:hypothetical protein